VHNGVATFNNLSLTKAGSYSFAFTASGLPQITSNKITVSPAAATHLVFAQQPAGTVAGTKLHAIIVDLEDQYGNLATGASSTVTLTLSDGSQLSGTTAVNAHDGVATFSDLTATEAGTHKFSASGSSLSGATSNTFQIIAGRPALLVVTKQPTNGMAGQDLAPVDVQIRDSYGNLVTYDTSNITASLSGAGLNGKTKVAVVNGVATFDSLSISEPGNSVSLNFTDSNPSIAQAVSSLFTIQASPATQLVFGPVTMSAKAGTTIPTFVVKVEDQNLVVTGDNSTIITIKASGGTAIQGVSSIKVTNGVAMFSGLSIAKAGQFTFTASNGTSTADSRSFTISPAAGAETSDNTSSDSNTTQPQLAFSTEPVDAIAGKKLSPIKIQTLDASGNLDATGRSRITLNISSGGQLYGKTTAIVKNGVATFKGLSIHEAGTYTLEATDPGFAGAESAQFTISPGAAKKVVFLSQPTSAVSGTPFNVSVELTDPYGNAVQTGSAHLVLRPHSNDAAKLNQSAAINDGLASFDGVTLSSAGGYALQVIDGKAQATFHRFNVR
jgi:hypothetical protein